MKKLILTCVAMCCMSVVANAQYVNKLWDNWSVGVEGGMSTNIHDNERLQGALAGVQVTKGLTPVYSIELGIGAGVNNNHSWLMQKSVNMIDNMSVSASGKVNLMNLFCGYKGKPRLFEVQARGGVGYLRYFYPTSIDNFKDVTGCNGRNDLNRAFAKVGLDLDLNLGEEKAWTVSVRPAVVFKVNSSAHGGMCDYTEAGMGCTVEKGQCASYLHNVTAQVTAGVTYHFKNSTGKHYFTKMDPEIVEKVIEKIVDRPVDKVVEKVVEKNIIKDKSPIVVAFAQNKAVLSEAGKAALNTLANGATVKIDGFASPEGAKGYNQKLSERRCQAVKAYLESRGVKVADINAHGAAGADSQRIVIVSLK